MALIRTKTSTLVLSLSFAMMNTFTSVHKGDVRLKQLHSIICYDSTTNEAKRKLQPEEKAGELSSWIHLNNEEDQRGRVGLDWPWNKN
jgi:hypothetical protein